MALEPIDIRARIRRRQGSTSLPPLMTPVVTPVTPPAAEQPEAPSYVPPSPSYTPQSQPAAPSAAAATPAAAPLAAPKAIKIKTEINKRMLIVALVCAGAASLLIVSYIRSSAGVLADQSKLLSVATVAKDVPARTMITKSMVTYTDVPALYVPANTATASDSIVGKVALSAMFAGETIHRKRLSDPNAETGLAVKIPIGHRAMAMQNKLAGLVKPGDFVDVFATVTEKSSKQIQIVPVLQHSLVLAVGAKVNATDDKAVVGSYDTANLATLAVPDEKVNLLTLLEEKGNFKLVLRAPNDETIMKTKYNDKQLMTLVLGAEELPKPKPVPLAPVAAPVVHEQPVYRAPERAYNPPPRAAAPRAAAPAPAKPAAAPPKPANNGHVTVTVINGGHVQQQDQDKGPQ
ncbi:MAG: Flp pilus assembly protein CpaB [Candidatus Sericytochromatia bacterium]|nr:Flp pilus assembly protein CpaB [Candidatus Sericytochromatia bacterium]